LVSSLHNIFSTVSLPRVFFVRVLTFFPESKSSNRRSQSASTLFSAIQLIEMILTSTSRNTELTRAVLPVPGDPDMYSVVPASGSPNDDTNSSIAARSRSRPAI
jgi:hypothetical protein